MFLFCSWCRASKGRNRLSKVGRREVGVTGRHRDVLVTEAVSGRQFADSIADRDSHNDRALRPVLLEDPIRNWLVVLLARHDCDRPANIAGDVAPGEVVSERLEGHAPPHVIESDAEVLADRGVCCSG